MGYKLRILMRHNDKLILKFDEIDSSIRKICVNSDAGYVQILE